MALQIKDGQTVLFIGDSITDCGRRGAAAPLGNGYVKLFGDLLTVREPAKQVRIVNKGIGGDTIVGLRERWTDDVLYHEPDWLSVKVGINDLHRGLNDPANGIPPDRFEEAYDEVLGRTAEGLPDCRILLIDPFYVSTARSTNTWRSTVLKALPDYIAVVHKMSKRYKAGLVKTHDMFQKLLRHHDADTFCPEPVHPHLTGHLAIAEAAYAALSR